MRKYGFASVLLVILIVAYGVRVHLLGAQSLWYDEGVAFGHSQRDLLDMIPLLQRNVHVPAYFWSLAVWEDLAGASEFSLRYLSVMFSLLSVAFTYALGKRLYGRAAGVAAAGFVALNTFSIYYAQEARMYAMLAAVAAASMWLFIGWTNAYRQQRRIFAWGLALAVVNALGMYTHFSYALVMVSQAVAAALWLVLLLAGVIRLERRPRPGRPREGMESIRTIGTTIRAALIYTILNLVTIALFSPWLPIALRQTSSQPNISDVVPLEQLVRVLQGWFAFGITFEQSMGGMGVAIYFFLLFGLLALPDRSRGQVWRLLLPVIWVLVSSAIYVWLGLYERYLRFLSPVEIAFALWLGRGVWNLWLLRPRRTARWAIWVPRGAAALATLALWLAMARGLPLLYDDARFQRDDYRGLAAAISAQVNPTDRVILSAPGLNEVFNYYYRGAAPVILIPVTNNPRTEADAVIASSRLIQAVYYGEREQDAAGVLEATLDADTYPIDSRWWGDVRWARYAAPRPTQPIDLPAVRFGEAVQLVSARISQTTWPAGVTPPLLLELNWQTDSSLTNRYKVFVQILSESGVLVAQRDSEPANGRQPTDQWLPTTPITDRHALLLDALPAGQYSLIVGLYDISSGQRLPVNNGDFLTLANLIVGG